MFPIAYAFKRDLLGSVPVSIKMPEQSDYLSMTALAILLSGDSITSPEFENKTGSWRLAACIHNLKSLGWPIQAQDVAYSSLVSRRLMHIAAYCLPEKAALGFPRSHSSGFFAAPSFRSLRDSFMGFEGAAQNQPKQSGNRGALGVRVLCNTRTLSNGLDFSC